MYELVRAIKRTLNHISLRINMMGSSPSCSSSRNSLSIWRLLLFGIPGLLLATTFITFYASLATTSVFAVGVLFTCWILASCTDRRRIPPNSYPAKIDPLPSSEAKMVASKGDLHGMMWEQNYHCSQQTDSDDCCDPFQEDECCVPPTLSESTATDEDPAESMCSEVASASHGSAAEDLISDPILAAGANFDNDDCNDWTRSCFDGSISDDDSLIEIALADGHPLIPWEEAEKDGSLICHQPPPPVPTTAPFLTTASTCRGLMRGPEPFSSPELQFLRRHGLIELLTEIGEEENLIEIDINMGSIKCPGFAGIRA